MKQIEVRINKMIDKFVSNLNKEIEKSDKEMAKIYPNDDWTTEKETKESLGIMLFFANDGDVAMDGEIFSTFIGQSDTSLFETLTEEIASFLYRNDYEYDGFGLFKQV